MCIDVLKYIDIDDDNDIYTYFVISDLPISIFRIIIHKDSTPYTH